jgi:hypothetical protein
MYVLFNLLFENYLLYAQNVFFGFQWASVPEAEK